MFYDRKNRLVYPLSLLPGALSLLRLCGGGARRIPHELYADAIIAELHERAPWFQAAGPSRLVSIYFGGGTPGLWRPAALGRVLTAVREAFAADGAIEITVEANPGDFEAGNLCDLRALGVNRLSFGAQAFQDRLLAGIGRGHRASAIPAAFAAARAAGFDNLCADLMFGLPGQSVHDWQASLEALVLLAPQHITAYALTVERNTRFGALERKASLARPGEDEVAAMYARGHEFLTDRGYEHYEISSYAGPAGRSVHNTLYWTMGAYLGLGVSASSFRPLAGGGGWRFTNTRSPQAYLRSPTHGQALIEFSELRAPADAENEALWLGLRTSDGVDRVAHKARYGRDPIQSPARAHAAEVCAEAGWLDITPERLRLLPAGFLFADEVAVRLLDDPTA